MLKIGQRLYNLTPDQAKDLVGATVQPLDEDATNYCRALIVRRVTRESDGDWRIQFQGTWLDFYIGDGSGQVNNYSIRILTLPDAANVTATTLGPETLDARIKRLRAELAEAEAEKAREGAPKGWYWAETSGVWLEQIEGGESVRFSPVTGWVCCVDADGDETAIDFDVIAALVDRVRRDRGETPAPTSAPVSAPRGASNVAIPDGWEVGEYVYGPVMHSDDYNVCMTYTDHPNEPYLTIYDHDDGESVNVPIIAMRAYLALCDM